ncbi:MAG: TetR/AcrR family transcriptional regulator [Alphaproteobacteria bacterium]|nr:TetR/AcrR family transcriptional regulator [Alphaproteobacteria bacterium]MBU1514626.1 TetR/AcrR family transcriptional regulator [Alphaproteobacteria bacterium]MBU2096742.1 TetR/AcrR family transcriptional regulator [Alphaproteobacteria bacterium]MBU2150374.1 TetR/AcrR family transcriptional regulator [Alphaproteobacteria bacterium]MBU2306625.1 TetR/AcrR family transcriptional regulator [Alphaproteobacteria bacterium]
MTREFASGGDPRRSIDLLWGSPERGRRGPKPRYSADQVVDAAVAIADAEGLQAISVRRIAQELGVSPMSIYTYVPSKAELVGLMFDMVLGETGDAQPPGQGWREALTHVACERWKLSERHPWMLDLALHRPPLGPNLLARHETALRILDATGLDDLTKDMVIDVLHSFLVGALLEAREAREAERVSGLTDAQWFAMAEPALTARLDPTKFQHVLRLGEAWRTADKAVVADPVWRFKFGLGVVLDGIGALIKARASGA